MATIEWRGGSCRFVARIPDDIAHLYPGRDGQPKTFLKETQKHITTRRQAEDNYPAWLAGKKEEFAAARAAISGVQWLSHLELRQAARDAARWNGYDLPIGDEVVLTGINPPPPTIKDLREALDRVGKAAKQQADEHIARKGWTLAPDSYVYFVGCVRNALEDRITYDLLKLLGEVQDTSGGEALDVLLKPAREPGKKSKFARNRTDDAEWNLGRKRITLLQAVGEFKARKEFKALSYTARQSYEDTFAILYQLFGEGREVHTVVPEDMTELSDAFPNLPMHIKQRLRKREKFKDLLEDDGEKIAAGTVNRHVTNTKQLWSWLMANHLIKHNPTANLARAKRIQKHTRAVLSSDDLKRVFITRAPEIHNGNTDSIEYWLPWLGLFTGARRGELLQLTPTDIDEIGGVPCLKIATLDDDDAQAKKSLKTAASARIVPIHSRLLRLGITEFAHRARKNANGKLFTELTWSETHGWTGKVEKFLTRVLHPIMGGRNLGKTFHSFRHTVTNRLLWKESVDPGLVDSLLGWSSTEREEIAKEVRKDLMRLHYGYETPAIERLREAMERLKFAELD